MDREQTENIQPRSLETFPVRERVGHRSRIAGSGDPFRSELAKASTERAKGNRLTQVRIQKRGYPPLLYRPP